MAVLGSEEPEIIKDRSFAFGGLSVLESQRAVIRVLVALDNLPFVLDFKSDLSRKNHTGR